jgi:hypothetical protein
VSKTLVLWIKVADDLDETEEQLIKDNIREQIEDHDSGAVVRADWQEDQE